MDDAAAAVVAEEFRLQQLADLIVAIQGAASARVLDAQPAQRVALHAQRQRIVFAGGVDDFDRQTARIGFDALDDAIEADFFDQVVVAVVVEAIGFTVLVDEFNEALRAVVHEVDVAAHRIDASRRLSARVAFVTRAVLGGVDHVGQAS